ESLGCLDNFGEKTPFANAITELLETASDRLVDQIWKLREALTTVGAMNQKSNNVFRQYTHGIIAKHLEEEEKEDVASGDTTSEEIAWMMYLLLREEADPELLKTSVKEIDEVLGDGFPTYETHKRQKFAEA
ncbi:hypothetical protein BGZ88_005974, partial [Linnemannia elongata]